MKVDDNSSKNLGINLFHRLHSMEQFTHRQKLTKNRRESNDSEMDPLLRLSHAQPSRSGLKWSQEEDKLLLDACKNYTDQNLAIIWTEVSKHVPWRAPQACKDRYTLQLNPNVLHKPFSVQEDFTIISKYNEFGSKWNLIQKYLPGRSSIQIKNRYYTALKTLKFFSKKPSFSKKKWNEI